MIKNKTENSLKKELNLNKYQKPPFDIFYNRMINTNVKLKDFVDWKKVYNIKNQDDIFLNLNKLNFLISASENEFYRKVLYLFENDKNVFNYLNLLLSIRDKNKIFIFNKQETNFNKINFEKIEDLNLFFKESNLMELFLNKNVNDLKDYYLGIEVGSDSNSRKNRNGKKFENLIEEILIENNIIYEKQVSMIINGKSKRFDFVLNINGKEYLTEINFYNTSGSKLNEVSRSYINQMHIINETGYEFIWITDGKIGWKGNSSLREAYEQIENIFNLSIFKEWIQFIKFDYNK